MSIEITQKLDKCSYCDSKAEYIWIKNTFWDGLQYSFLCNIHKLELAKARKFK